MRAPQIAIADDDTAFANYLKTFLEARGYLARVYSHGEDLLAAARLGELPDVVLLDVMMPGMDGIATLRSLKTAHQDLQVIMLSGREHAQTIVEALNLGAVNYVVKPARQEEVLARLTRDTGRRAQDDAPPAWRWQGRAVKVVDGSTLGMPDTPANQAAYPQSRRQAPGLGSPIARVVVLFWTTCVCAAAVLPRSFGSPE